MWTKEFLLAVTIGLGASSPALATAYQAEPATPPRSVEDASPSFVFEANRTAPVPAVAFNGSDARHRPGEVGRIGAQARNVKPEREHSTEAASVNATARAVASRAE